ncbi:uncharacterized protein TM35_000151180 [Trypanosoma theileri]|uniref:Archaic Translocase of outer membrane 14 kDa subunit n=1 Tax=Trypanosoma theileri TaxID=67003 RepID=A0A1X0NVH1_9TRYP|nr:uncharacterized protein TM35_000151180 [Trypanosoma theileri]ORC88687.1 hypothetical protein TM35_000151180 [Trypanosoma theileri]
MSGKFSEFVEKYHILPVYRSSLTAVMTAWGWVSERTWPIYSTGVILSVLCMLASAQEKQILADHLYGCDARFQQQQEPKEKEAAAQAVEEARKLFHEESSQGVKQVVWMLPRDEFRREYEERHGRA